MDIDDLLSQLPIEQIAASLGVDEKTAEQATRQALPALIGGMQANAQDDDGAKSLAKALDAHDNDLVKGGVNLDDVDTDDGEKIVTNVFGNNREQVVNQLAGFNSEAGSGLISKLLPMLAPIVLSYLAGKVKGGGDAAPSQQAQSGGGLADILGGLLGGGSGGSGGGQSGGLGGLGDLLGSLGGLLGGGKR